MRGWLGRLATRLQGRPPRAVGLSLGALLVAMGLAASGGFTISPIVQAPASQSEIADVTATPAATATPSPSPKPTLPPTMTFVMAGSMNHARGGATATLLKNGKVLIAGGANWDEAIMATAELFDPSTGKFTPTGMMTEARDGHSATLLSDGRVLIAGGEGCNAQFCSETARFRVVEPVSTAEIYNPKTGMFSRTGSMLGARLNHAATLLPDGRVLLVGRSFTETNQDLASDSAELYDPKTGKFTLAGSALDFGDPSAILLPNGKVLITDSNGSVGELYDPKSAKFSEKQLGYVSTPTLLKDGRVLLYEGGVQLETYDPATGVVTQVESASDLGADFDRLATLSGPTATLLADGRVLFEGGVVGDQYGVPDAWLYDPVRGITIIGPMHVGRSGNTATLLNDGRVLITGGANRVLITGELNDEKWAASAELFTIGPASSASPAPSASATPSAAPTRTPKSGGVFFQTGSMPGDGWGAASALLPDGRVLVTSGALDAPDSLPEIFNPATGLWSEGSSMVYGRFGHTATLLRNGKVLIAGCATSKKAELYDPATGKFKVTGTMRVLTCYQTAVLLANGRVLIAGGVNGGTYLKSAEIYDPATGTFSTTGSMNEARADARAVLLPDGRVLIAGGDRGSDIMNAMFLGSAEIYDPATGKFTPTGSMKDKRTLFCAMLLADGKVLVAGGARFYDGEIVEAAETYDPATGRFTPLDSLAGAGGNELDDMWAVLLHDGRVLFSGSADGGIRSILYDPKSGKFSRSGPLPAGGSMAPIVLRDGRVLIPGQPSLLYVP